MTKKIVFYNSQYIDDHLLIQSKLGVLGFSQYLQYKVYLVFLASQHVISKRSTCSPSLFFCRILFLPNLVLRE